MVGKGHTLSVTGNWDRRIDRRKFLAMSGMSAAALALGAQGLWLPRGGLAQTQGGYFQLGVASGDPELYDDTASGSKKVSVILWTRLAPGDAFVLPRLIPISKRAWINSWRCRATRCPGRRT
jgi:hypothetical protein